MSLIVNQKQLEEMIGRIESRGLYSFDTETTGLLPFNGDKVIGISFAVPTPDLEGIESTHYAPFRHLKRNEKVIALEESVEPIKKSVAKANLAAKEEVNREIQTIKETEGEYRPHPANNNLGQFRPFLQQLFGNPDLECETWNNKFDVHMTENEGIIYRNKTREVLLAAHLLDENNQPYELKRFGELVLGEDATAEDRALKEWGKRHGVHNPKTQMPKVDLDVLVPYAEKDAEITRRLSRFFRPRLKEQNLYELWLELCDYCDAFRRMERNGLPTDPAILREKYAVNLKEQERLLGEVHRIAGVKLNLNSPKQLCAHLKIQSSAKEVLEKLDHPTAKKIVEYRKYVKAGSTYYKAWLEYGDTEGRVHTSVKLHGTVAGRPSSTKPNVFNVPKMDEDAVFEEEDVAPYEIKECVVAPPGYSLLEMDYSQGEYRVTGSYTQDEVFLLAYPQEGEGIDLHALTASRIFKVDVSEVTKGQRHIAKTSNFLALYGGQADALSKTAKIGVEEAKEILRLRAIEMPKTVAFERQLIRFAEKNRYILLWTGRRRRFPKFPRYVDTHTALNNLIQGGLAEIMRIATTRLDKMFLDIEESIRPKIVLQVYDSLMFEVRDDLVEHWARVIKPVMEDFKQFKVPIKVDGKAGKTWATMEKLKLD